MNQRVYYTGGNRIATIAILVQSAKYIYSDKTHTLRIYQSNNILCIYSLCWNTHMQLKLYVVAR